MEELNFGRQTARKNNVIRIAERSFGGFPHISIPANVALALIILLT